VGGVLVQDDLRLGGDDTAIGTGMRVRFEDGLDRATVTLLGDEPGVDVAHCRQIPGNATGRDAASHGGVIGGDGHRAGDDGEWLGPETGVSRSFLRV
jgi:hypothetical protein